MPLQFEAIEWLDHCTFADNSWRSEQSVKELEPVTVLTLGFVVHETKDWVTVVSTINNSGSLSGEFLILKKVITNRKKIKLPIKGWQKG